MHIEGLANLRPEGSGGFSQVFRATEVRYGRKVAAKVLNFRLDDPADRERFERECMAMAQLSDHPYIVPLYSTSYSDEGYPVIIMEFFAGGTLWAHARKGATPAMLLDAGVKLASALHTAHERGVTHRDVKPQNVLMSTFGEPGLTDFGISALDRHKSAHGRPRGITIAYAAPEALDGASSRRTDIYSLAAALYTVLADRRPYDLPGRKQSTNDLVQRILSEDPPALDSFGLATSIDRAVRRAGMARNPSDRPETAAEFGELLRRAQGAAGYTVTPWLEATETTDTSAPTSPTHVGEDVRSVLAPTVGAAAESFGDPTPGSRIDPSAMRSSRRLVAAAAGIAAVALVVLLGFLARDRLSAGEDPLPAVTPPAIPTTDDFYAPRPVRPTQVTIEHSESGATMHWTDPNTAEVTFQIQQVIGAVATGEVIETTGTSADLGLVASGDCYTIRALGERGQVSQDAAPVCLEIESAP